MSDRKAELEKKKAKLQAIREEKERRRREKEQRDAEEAAARKPNPDQDQKKVDEMLSSLGIAPVSDVLSSLSSSPSLTNPDTSGSLPVHDLSSLQSTPSLPSRKKGPQLSVVSVQTTSIPPKEVVSYTKQTQTTHTSTERDAQAFGYYGPPGSHQSGQPLRTEGLKAETESEPHSGVFNRLSDEYNLNPGLEWEDEFTVLTYDDHQAEDEESSLPPLVDGFQSKLPPGILPHGLPKVKDMEPAVTAVETEQKKETKQIRELSDDEKMMMVLSEDFQRFVDKTSRIMERALAESADIYADYTGLMGLDDLGDERAGGTVSVSRCFFDERWTRTRCVTSLDWSPQYPELLLASYHNSIESAHDPDGVCLIWNSKFKKSSPEYVFHCQSTVLSATFAKFHPNLILGGTYSGQVVLWDNRVQKRTPIQRTPLSSFAHTHPVYCMQVVGTPNAHNLISVSTDGRLCSWSLDMLSQPQETLELQHRQSKAIAVTSLDFPFNDVNNFVIGSEEGAVYSASRHGTKAGMTDTYDGHQGPITGINTHKVQGPVDYSHLFLTSSFDWTIKLWNLKENKAVYSFEDNGDYVYDVAWSPVHPSVFAAVDGTGRLDIWDLNSDTEVPVAKAVSEQGTTLNRLAWSSSGSHIAVGDDLGKIHLYDIPEHLYLPRADEWNKLLITLQELKNNQADDEMDKISLSSGPSSITSFVSR